LPQSRDLRNCYHIAFQLNVARPKRRLSVKSPRNSARRASPELTVLLGSNAMKTIAWSSVVGGALCLGLLGCSAGKSHDATSSPTGGGNTPATGGAMNQPVLGLGGGGTSQLGNVNVSGSGGSGGGDVCQTGGADFVPKVPTVMLLVDRSGTMFANQGNPWGTLRDGVLPIVKDLNDQVRFGFMAVTGEQAAGMCPLLDEVAPADKNYDAISAKYMALTQPMKGESPGMLGLQRAYEVLSADTTPGDKYVLFVTDGEQDYCGDGNPLCPTDSVVYWLQKLKALNVTTMIFGLPSSGDQTSYGSILQSFANAGAGQPVAPVVAANQTALDIYNQCFYGGDTNATGWKAEFAMAAKVDDAATTDVDESKTLGNYAAAGGAAKVFKPDPNDQTALATEFRNALAGVKSCTFDIGGDIKVVQSLLSEAHVYIEGTEVPLDMTASNGWHMPTATQIELVGDACTQWRMPQNNKITWDFPCKILEPR
jgi:hypothetical protein